MNGNKIINVADGVDDSDVVTIKQLNQHPNPNWYYYTSDLRHEYAQVVALNIMNKYPFFVDENSGYMRISKSGFYQIIYNDTYSGHGIAVLYNETNNEDLVRQKMPYAPFGNKIQYFSFNTIFQINLKDGQGHNEISIFIEKISRAVQFYGKGYSTFYIKYLHP